MAQMFEMMMLICFGISWPLNIVKSLRSHTAKGKSLLFEICIVTGYCFGLAGKFISGNVTYVAVFYVLDILMVSTDLILTCRNRKLDHLAKVKFGEIDSLGTSKPIGI
ncbi:hypothetical protein [uncultured Dysosmobacter sp.]|uniref:hypothetical protein n=1 Tax=uncultured Dysosmobacter sp. TaxID=2591384 RepID=UPI0026289522|nr:hypothetical protein [uncultured Dysosmobacter sp.]